MIQTSELKEEVRRVADAIRNVFHVQGDLDEDDVEAIHTQLTECVETVNERLRKCDDLLRKGLRGEAIQECEIEPNLFELVTELDIPEWEAWADYVRQFSIPPQPDLLVDVAAALNDAYTQASSIDELLSLHRLYALARSPLPARIQILRAIAARDKENVVWQDDLRSYETARFHQIETQFRSDRT